MPAISTVGWGYDDNMANGELLDGWASIDILALLYEYNAKDAASFYSGRKNTGTNPDIAFASVGPHSCLRIDVSLKSFPGHNINHRLSTPTRFAMAVPSMPVNR